MQSSLESDKTRKRIYFLNKLGTFSSLEQQWQHKVQVTEGKWSFTIVHWMFQVSTSPETPNDWPQRALPADFSLNPLNQQRSLQKCMKETIICSVLYSKLNTVSNIPQSKLGPGKLKCPWPTHPAPGTQSRFGKVKAFILLLLAVVQISVRL